MYNHTADVQWALEIFNTFSWFGPFSKLISAAKCPFSYLFACKKSHMKYRYGLLLVSVSHHCKSLGILDHWLLSLKFWNRLFCLWLCTWLKLLLGWEAALRGLLGAHGLKGKKKWERLTLSVQSSPLAAQFLKQKFKLHLMFWLEEPCFLAVDS